MQTQEYPMESTLQVGDNAHRDKQRDKISCITYPSHFGKRYFFRPLAILLSVFSGSPKKIAFALNKTDQKFNCK